jgi:tetrahydromethanopterin S-methyltransferase subunit G
MADIDTRLSRIEGIVDQIVQRLTSLEGRMNSLDNRLDNMDMRLDNMEGRMASHLKWIIGLLLTILIAIFGTSITILINLPK